LSVAAEVQQSIVIADFYSCHFPAFSLPTDNERFVAKESTYSLVVFHIFMIGA